MKTRGVLIVPFVVDNVKKTKTKKTSQVGRRWLLGHLDIVALSPVPRLESCKEARQASKTLNEDRNFNDNHN